jgi:25S rRNA (uracil2634-N3)-methyltransferase
LKRHHRVGHVTATCYDSKEAVEDKYPGVRKTVDQLLGSSGDNSHPTTSDPHSSSHDVDDDQAPTETEWKGFSPSPPAHPFPEDETQAAAKSRFDVLYGIDATKLSSAHKKALRPYAPFTKIVFNFPHVGGLSTDVNRQVRYNQELLVGFFKAAIGLLSSPSQPSKMTVDDDDDDEDDTDQDEGDDDDGFDGPFNSSYDSGAVNGQILVTLFEGEPYTLWNIRDLARHSGLKVVESFQFPWSAYPGYQHARTIGEITSGKDRSEQGQRKGAWRGEERVARCYVLEDKNAVPPVGPPHKRKKKKRSQGDGDADGSD